MDFPTLDKTHPMIYYHFMHYSKNAPEVASKSSEIPESSNYDHLSLMDLISLLEIQIKKGVKDGTISST